MTTPRSSGYSRESDHKWHDLTEVQRQQLEIVCGVYGNAPTAPYPYFFLETHAGPGIWPDGTIGSPIIALRLLEASGLRYEAHFIEASRARAAQLQAALAEHFPRARWRVYHGDYATVLPQIAAGLPCDRAVWRRGLFFVDPTGLLGDRDELAAFRQIAGGPLQRVDLLLNISATAIKRAWSAGNEAVRFKEVIAHVPKRYAAIRELSAYGGWQWTFVLFTNWKPLIDKYGRLGFHDVRSPRGQEIIETAEHTIEELRKRGQPPLDPTAEGLA